MGGRGRGGLGGGPGGGVRGGALGGAGRQAGGDHPEEVLPIYERVIEQTLAHTGNDVYERAVGLLRKVQALLRRLGREQEFAGRVASIRTVQRRKRNLIKLLDAAGW